VSEFNPWDSEVHIPPADLDAVGDGIVVTYIDEEALKLVEDSALMADHIVDTVLVDMS
jgi:hypothetical protein